MNGVVLVNHVDGLSFYGKLHMHSATTIIYRWGCISALLWFVLAVFTIWLFLSPLALDAVLAYILEARAISALLVRRRSF
jgi:hypothetical protein